MLALMLLLVGLVPTDRATADDSSVRAHWKFDELEPQGFADASGHGRTIPLLTEPGVYDLQLTTLDHGRALVLNRDWLYVTLPEDAIAGNRFSFEAVVFVPTQSGDERWKRSLFRLAPILGTMRGADRKLIAPHADFILSHDGALTWALSDGTTARTSAGALRRDVWQHVAAVADDAEIRVLVNGQIVARAARVGSTPIPWRGLLSMGSWAQETRTNHALAMDEVRILARALQAPEVAERWRQVSRQYPVTQRPASDKPVRFSVMTYNTFHGFRGYGPAPATAPAPAVANPPTPRERSPRDTALSLVPTFARFDLDFIALQEVASSSPPTEALAQALNMQLRQMVRGGALMSRLRFTDPQNHLPFDFDKQFKGQTRHVFSVRLEVPGYGPVDVYAVHLWPAIEELVEDVHLLQLLEQRRRLGIPQVIVGDFNRLPEAELFRRLAQRGWQSPNTQDDPTLRGTKVRSLSAIDHIWWRGLEGWQVQENAVVREAAVIPDATGWSPSDHLPVRATWVLPVADRP